MNNTSKAKYFLVELIVNSLLFAICAAICASLYAMGFVQSKESKDISRAMVEAQNAAEAFKAAAGDTSQLIDMINCNEDFVIYYDKDWNNIADGEDYSYQLKLEEIGEGKLKQARISLSDLESSEILTIEVSKYLPTAKEVG